MQRYPVGMAIAAWFLAAGACLADDMAELKKYQYGGDQAALLAVERQVEESLADPAAQRRMAARLVDVLTDRDATLAAKQHAGILLRMCGTEGQVPALAGLLKAGPVGDFARGALERIPGAAAAEALREALLALQGTPLVAVIHSTANRGDREAIEPLSKLTADKDAQVAAAAVHALGRIGGPRAASCLKTLVAASNDTATAEAYLACGTLAMAAGDKTGAGEIFAALSDARYPSAVRRGALTGQFKLSGDPGALLMAWLDGQDAVARRVAEMNLATQPTAWLLASMRGRTAAQAIGFAEALAARRESGARPTLMQAARQKDDLVLRERALMALAKVGDGECVPVLIDALDDASLSKAALTALSTMPGELVDGPLLEAFRRAQARQRARLSDVLLARRMTKALPLVLELAKVENDAAMRDDVCTVLVALGDDTLLPGLVALLLTAENAQHRDRLETTYLEIAKQHQNTVEPIVGAMRDDASTARLLPVLGRVGGAVARRKIDEALASTQQGLRAAGVRAICNWPDAAVAPQLADLAKQDQDLGVQISALRAYIRVVSLKGDRTPTETLAMLKGAYGMAQRVEEKRLAVQRAEAVRHMQTLRWLVGLLEEEAVREEACSSIVELAHHRDLRNPNRDEFAKALQRVVAASKDAETVRRAKGYLEGV